MGGGPLSGPWMEGTPPFQASTVSRVWLRLSIIYLPAVFCFETPCVPCTPSKTQLHRFGPLWDPLQLGPWRTVSFLGTMGGLIGSRDNGPMEGH